MKDQTNVNNPQNQKPLTPEQKNRAAKLKQKELDWLWKNQAGRKRGRPVW